MRLSLLLLSVAALMTAPAFAQPPRSPGEVNEIRAENCMVQYIDKVDVPARAEGTLTELHFEEGETVDKDSVLAVIDDTAAKLTLQWKKAEEVEAILNATNDINKKDAVNAEALATEEAKAYRELFSQRAIPKWEMEKKRLEAERAKLRIDLADMNMKIAEAQMHAKFAEVKIADFELTRRKVTAPSTGFIEVRLAQLGQWVQPGTPIATLIQMDKLRVEGDIDALRYPGQILKGTPVKVLVYSNANNEDALSFDGVLGFVSMEIDLRNRYRVWVELENRKVGDDWLIKPGMRAEIIIQQRR